MSKEIEFVIVLFGGPFGLHKFLKGDVKMGFVYLFTIGLFGVGWIMDMVKVLTRKTDTKRVVSNGASIEKTESERRKAICRFEKGISKEEFRTMVKRSGKNIEHITGLFAEGALVFGTIKTSNEASGWCFKIDFNDFGELTGEYCIEADNKQSVIPKIIAERIAQQIHEYPECMDEGFEQALFYEEIGNIEIKKNIKSQETLFCTYCGKQRKDTRAQFCTYCGNKVSE